MAMLNNQRVYPPWFYHSTTRTFDDAPLRGTAKWILWDFAIQCAGESALGHFKGLFRSPEVR